VILLAAGDPICPCVFLFVGIAFAIAITTIPTGRRPVIGGVRYESVGALVHELERLLGMRGFYSSQGEVTDARLEGPISTGRPARVDFFKEQGGSKSPAQFFARFLVAADEAPFLHVTRETPWTPLLKAIGVKREIEVGDRAFDDSYLLETREPDRARDAFARTPELKRLIDALFAVGGTKEVTLERGRLWVAIDARRIHVSHFSEVLDLLDQVARLFDRKSITVRVLEAERLALVDESGKTRCPYCHGAIQGDEDALVACDACRTVLHEACWTELQRCPLLGCRGRSPERRRAT
jgi:hypothetical protein